MAIKELFDIAKKIIVCKKSKRLILEPAVRLKDNLTDETVFAECVSLRRKDNPHIRLRDNTRVTPRWMPLSEFKPATN